MKILRRLSVPLFLLAVGAVFLYAYLAKPFESDGTFCVFNATAGIHCPTCGATRAVYSMLSGDFKSAFYYHALLTVGCVPAFIVGVLALINFTAGKKIIPLPKFRWAYFYAAVGVVAAFTAIRNFLPQIY
ncbi:MAG: DUF2752 domain-containing protein [Clostridia bacterium]|nr:DUF2752 domain-containing protein [Clostridia bacterium]